MRSRTRCPLSTLFITACFLAPLFAIAADDVLTIPAGSTLQVQLLTTLSSKTSQTGDPWTGKIVEPFWYKGHELIPVSSVVEGRVTFVKLPGKVKGVGEMRLIADTLTTPDQTKYTVSASLEDAQAGPGVKIADSEGTLKGPSSKKDDIAAAGKGAAAGAAVGGLARGGTGALYGAAIGAAAMGIRGLFKRGKDLVLYQGTELTLAIERDTIATRVTTPASTPESTQKPTQQ